MTGESFGLLYMLNDAGPVVKFVMLILLFFSIISWA
ncbi:MAG: Tol-Pal system subunit TolQ, partial [Desulfobacteraceae bacterium]|nr:Tol-Pal system subunit TolQ [Desulfobacteraceae bacterium]